MDHNAMFLVRRYLTLLDSLSVLIATFERKDTNKTIQYAAMYTDVYNDLRDIEDKLTDKEHDILEKNLETHAQLILHYQNEFNVEGLL